MDDRTIEKNEQLGLQQSGEHTQADANQSGEQQATGTPYWNGIQQDPRGGYIFTGSQGGDQGSAGSGHGSAGNQGAATNGAHRGGYAPYNNYAGATKSSKMPGWVKGLIIFLVVCIGLVGLSAACSSIVKNATGSVKPNQETYDFYGNYIGVLYLEGTMTDGVSGDGYSQDWILERIEQMTEEENNRGIMLHINTPGGSAYATSEVYKALLNYKEKTGNPVYVYMGSQATSGGYYVAMAADKIYANEECWTGSIGVVVGTLYDVSELMEKYGIKAVNIVSGSNKDMGAISKPLSQEQIAILQSLVDESFDRFVRAVVDGRGLSESTVRKLADGRIYSAKQALDAGLIDAIGSLDDAVADMREANDLGDVKTEAIEYFQEADLFSMFGFQSQGAVGQASSDLSILMQLMDESAKASIEFICPIRK